MSAVYANPDYIHAAFSLTPKEGAVDKIVAELVEFSKHAEANEPGTLSYSIATAKPLNLEGNDNQGPQQIVVSLIFKDEASMTAHRTSDEQAKFAEKMRVFQDDLTELPELRSLTPAGGFVMKK